MKLLYQKSVEVLEEKIESLEKDLNDANDQLVNARYQMKDSRRNKQKLQVHKYTWSKTDLDLIPTIIISLLIFLSEKTIN